jgi:hypothetical protein
VAGGWVDWWHGCGITNELLHHCHVAQDHRRLQAVYSTRAAWSEIRHPCAGDRSAHGGTHVSPSLSSDLRKKYGAFNIKLATS